MLNTLARYQWVRSFCLLTSSLIVVLHGIFALTQKISTLSLLHVFIYAILIVDAVIQFFLELPSRTIPLQLRIWVVKYVRFWYDPRGRAIELFFGGLFFVLMGALASGLYIMLASCLGLSLSQLCADSVRYKLEQVNLSTREVLSRFATYERDHRGAIAASEFPLLIASLGVDLSEEELKLAQRSLPGNEEDLLWDQDVIAYLVCNDNTPYNASLGGKRRSRWFQWGKKSGEEGDSMSPGDPPVNV